MRFTKLDSAEAAPGPHAWRALFLIWLICLFNYADRQALYSVFPLLQKELALSPQELGWIGGAFSWLYGLGAPFAGFLVDRVERRRAILWGFQLWSWICCATAFASTFSSLLVFRALEGIGETFYYPAAVSLLSAYFPPEHRSRALGLLVTGVYAGTVGGGALAAWLGENWGWRAPFVVFGLSGVLLGVVVACYLREPVMESGGSPLSEAPLSGARLSWAELARTWREALANKALRNLLQAFVFANFAAVVLLVWTTTYLHGKFGYSVAIAGLGATLVPQLASLGGASLGGYMADRAYSRDQRGRMWLQAVAVLLAAPFVVLCGSASSAAAVFIAMGLWGFFKGFYDANIFASAFDVVPAASRGAIAGMMNFFGWLIGGGLAPVAVGALSERLGLGAAISWTGLAYILAAIFLLRAARDANVKL